MGHHVGFRYLIMWTNPYADPPNGMPKIKAEMFESIDQREKRYESGDRNPTPIRFSSKHELGDGYAVCIQSVSTPTRSLSKGSLATVRRKRLERRMSKKYPLLAKELMAEEIQKNKDYYEGETREDIKRSYDEAIQAEIDMYEKFLAGTGTQQRAPTEERSEGK